jgi:hypothetical protein
MSEGVMRGRVWVTCGYLPGDVLTFKIDMSRRWRDVEKPWNCFRLQKRFGEWAEMACAAQGRCPCYGGGAETLKYRGVASQTCVRHCVTKSVCRKDMTT